MGDSSPRHEWRGLEGVVKKEEKKYVREHLLYESEGALEPKKGEMDSDYYGRIEDFRSWLLGGSASEHISVEKWAKKEFKKHRKKIREMLNNG